MTATAQNAKVSRGSDGQKEREMGSRKSQTAGATERSRGQPRIVSIWRSMSLLVWVSNSLRTVANARVCMHVLILTRKLCVRGDNYSVVG
eukprot:4735382-Pleurochrysis_carterae.AAC.9